MNQDSFTLYEMRQAFNKAMEGKLLSERESKLAEARAAAVRCELRGLGKRIDHGVY